MRQDELAWKLRPVTADVAVSLARVRCTLHIVLVEIEGAVRNVA